MQEYRLEWDIPLTLNFCKSQIIHALAFGHHINYHSEVTGHDKFLKFNEGSVNDIIPSLTILF